jgi:hypothetical protein
MRGKMGHESPTSSLFQAHDPMLKDVIRSQFHAALSMMQQVVDKCPPALWHRAEDKNKYWQVVYHALFYTHLYLQSTAQDFLPWSGHIPGSENMDPIPNALYGEPDYGSPYTKEDLLNYLTFCRQQVDNVVPALDLHAESGFDWLPMSKIEVQFYSMRHLQLHIGELAERLWVTTGIEGDWVGKGP